MVVKIGFIGFVVWIVDEFQLYVLRGKEVYLGFFGRGVVGYCGWIVEYFNVFVFEIGYCFGYVGGVKGQVMVVNV